jgi:homogentisate phytyltransferase/homogentisate geranylgeranyltransferase
MPRENNFVLEKLEKILSFFEKERFGILSIFIWIFILSVTRMYTEAQLLGYAYKDITAEYLFAQLHITCFFITVYIGGVLILKYFTKQKLAKVANLAALGFIMVIVPPFIDILMEANPTPYTYGSPLWFVEIFQSFFNQSGQAVSESLFEGGAGIIFELLGILIATSAYVLIRTKSLVKTFLNAVSFLLLFIIIGSPFLILLRNTAGQIIHPLFIFRYIAISIVFLLILLWVCNKNLFKSFIKSSRLTTTAHFALMVIIGVLIAGHLQRVEFIEMNLFKIDSIFFQIFSGNIGTFFLSIVIIVFVWQYAVMINHVYDINIDRLNNLERVLPKNMLTRKQVKKIAIVYSLIAVGLSATLGIYTFLLVIIGLFFGTIYSVPPIRLRDGIFSTTIIGIGSAIAFFIGYVTPGYVKVMHGEMAGGIVRTYPEFTPDALVIGLIIFVALTIGPLIKDYKDYEGDNKAGVKNLFTIYGLEKGVTITSILLPVPFLLLLLLFNNLIDIFIIFPLGILSGLLFKFFRKTAYVFVIYFPLIVYCLLRWFEIIQL